MIYSIDVRAREVEVFEECKGGIIVEDNRIIDCSLFLGKFEEFEISTRFARNKFLVNRNT